MSCPRAATRTDTSARWYGITWVAHLPGGTTALAIGGDQKNEVLLSVR